MTNYERALAAAKTDKERNRLKEVGLQYGLGPDSVEWVQYALMGDLAGRMETAAEMTATAAKAVQHEKTAPRASTLVVTPDTAQLLVDELAKSMLALRTDTALKVESGLHTAAEGLMKTVAKSALAISPKWYVLRVVTLCVIGAIVFVFAGLLTGYSLAVAGYRFPVHTHALSHALTDRAQHHT